MRRTPRALLFRASNGLLTLVLGLVFVSADCTKTVLYSYIRVHVMIDKTSVSDDQLEQVTSCVFRVTGAETSQGRNLKCPPRNVHRDLGSFEWETEVQQGALQFVVQIFDANQVLIGEGTSDSVALSPGQHQTNTSEIAVLVLGLQPSVPDGGMMSDAVSDDGNVDSATIADGSTTTDAGTPDGAAIDLAIDAGSADGLPTDLAPGDAAGDTGAPADAGIDAPPSSDVNTDGLSGDGARDGITDSVSDGLEAG